jgi:hypothetical protein
MQVWRIHIRPGGGDPSITHADCINVCLRKGILGVGWGLPATPADPFDPREVWKLASDPENGYERQSLNSFSYALNSLTSINQGDLLWTRDTRGMYYLGRVTGPYRYTDDEDCQAVDLCNVVPTELRQVGTPSAVPGKIVSAFRPPRTVQRINGRSVTRYSEYLWSVLNDEPTPGLKNQNVFDFLDAEELEDVIFVMLQNDGYVVFPNGRKGDTMSYEYVLRERSSGKEVVTQVKSGKTPVDFQKLPENISAIVFQPNGYFRGEKPSNVKIVSPDKLLQFMKDHIHLLPQNVHGWLRLTGA